MDCVRTAHQSQTFQQNTGNCGGRAEYLGSDAVVRTVGLPHRVWRCGLLLIDNGVGCILKTILAVALTTLGCLVAPVAQGTIAITNDVVPALVTSDPWDVGGPLIVGELLTGEMSIDAGSEVTNTDGYVANGLGSVGVVSVTGADTTWGNTGELRLGNAGKGTLTISAGATVSASGNTRLGNLPSGDGTATVSGLGSTLSSTNFVLVGREGSGALNVLNGGSVTDLIGGIAIFEESVGAATVDGVGSSWSNSDELQVADGGTAFLNILSGGAVSNPRGFIGIAPAGIGNVVVSGAQSQWDNSDQLQIGYGGTGILDVTAGAQVTSGLGYVGSQLGGNGTATIDGLGSVWMNTNELSVGYEGTGALRITSGGKVSDRVATIGNLSTGAGSALVEGAGSMWITTESLTVGGFGIGSLEISHGGVVSAGAIDGSGGLNFNGGALRVMNSDAMGNPITLSPGGGMLEVPEAASVLTFTGTFSGDGELVKIGAGTLELAGNGSHSGSTRVLGGALQLGAAVLGHTGDVYLDGGALALSFLGIDEIGALYLGGAPQPIGTYGGAGSGADFVIPQIAGTGLLRVTSVGLPGDYNDDGAVDAADYTLWRDRTEDGGALANDPSLGVAADDYARWVAQFGLETGAGDGTNSNLPTPEPDSALLALLSVAYLSSFRRSLISRTA